MGFEPSAGRLELPNTFPFFDRFWNILEHNRSYFFDPPALGRVGTAHIITDSEARGSAQGAAWDIWMAQPPVVADVVQV